MTHAHLSVEHFISDFQTSNRSRSSAGKRPEWLCGFVDRIAELFEPVSPMGRVGFDCRWTGDRWELEMFLGRVELVGGMLDGQSRHASFQFDLKVLLGAFGSVDDFHWEAFADDPESDEVSPISRIVISGAVDANPIRLTLFEVPPNTSGPALRQYPDGRYEPV